MSGLSQPNPKRPRFKVAPNIELMGADRLAKTRPQNFEIFFDEDDAAYYADRWGYHRHIPEG